MLGIHILVVQPRGPIAPRIGQMRKPYDSVFSKLSPSPIPCMVAFVFTLYLGGVIQLLLIGLCTTCGRSDC